MRALYHFTMSPFSRRTRVCLALKGLEVALREARENPAYLAEARALSPLGTMPVLVEGDLVLGTSQAILAWLDLAHPGGRTLWPALPADRQRALEVVALVDGVLDPIVDLATRYFPLSEHPEWPRVRDERLVRVKACSARLAQLATQPSLTGGAFGAAEAALYALVKWFEGMPDRAPTNATIRQVMGLGYKPEEGLSVWARVHDQEPAVRAVYG